MGLFPRLSNSAAYKHSQSQVHFIFSNILNKACKNIFSWLQNGCSCVNYYPRHIEQSLLLDASSGTKQSFPETTPRLSLTFDQPKTHSMICSKPIGGIGSGVITAAYDYSEASSKSWEPRLLKSPRSL